MQRIKLYSKVININEVIVFDDPPKIDDYGKPISYEPIYTIYKNMIVDYLFNNMLPSGNYTVQLTFVNILLSNEGLRIFHNRNEQ